MISITDYERVAETLGVRLQYNWRRNCHTLFLGVNALDGDLGDDRFRRGVHDVLAARAMAFLAETPANDPRRPEVVTFLNRC